MQSADCLIVIPARWGSSRLPGKPLLQLAGKPLIQWVVEAALQVRNATGVVVATDDAAIAAAACEAGAEAMLTRASHRNGTERLLEVMAQRPAAHYLNLQGDEPLLSPSDLERLIEAMRQPNGADVLSLRHPISPVQAQDPARVKVVCGADGRALYFSRSPLPWGAEQHWQHVGVYGFQCSSLKRIARLQPTALESCENLEQLRWLEAGLSLQLLTTQRSSQGLDTPGDRAPVALQLRLRQVRAVLCDVDGVLTDGRLWYGPEGEQLKAFHARDGWAIKTLLQAGIPVGLVSARDGEPLRRRAAELGLKHWALGKQDKAAACQGLLAEMGVDAAAAAYVGDDHLDLPALQLCGLGVAVADAVATVQAEAELVLETAGGAGALRELADHILAAQQGPVA
jgi:3-deoxy-manno-octulosonate cytidylyltransferase (CMP-KDO synthetase)